MALSSGDDYELCFSAPPENAQDIYELGRSLGVTVTEIGQVIEGEGVQLIDQNGTVIPTDRSGYEHF